MPAYRAVLFDFFGTLTHAVARGARHRTVADLLGCTPDSLATALDESYFLRASGRLGNAADCLRWVCDRAGVRPSEAALHAAVRARRAAVRDDTRLRADAVTTLRALRARGLQTGVISDCTHEVPGLLADLPVAPLLDTRVFSVEVGRCKPDPLLYLTACAALGVPAAQCLYVGDGGSRELSGARGIGMTAVRLAAPDLAWHLVYDSEPGWHGPTLTSLGEVVGMIDTGAPVSGDGPGAAGTAWPSAVPPASGGARRPASRPAVIPRQSAGPTAPAGSARTPEPTAGPGR